MNYAKSMLQAYPKPIQVDTNSLAECIKLCYECAQMAAACADACLGEGRDGELTACIRLCLDCADICETTGRVLSRQTEPNWSVVRNLLAACENSCRATGNECQRFGNHYEYCRECADLCRTTAAACNTLAEALPAGQHGVFGVA